MATDNTTQTTCRVLVVDDHAVVRQGTRDLLMNHPSIDVIGDVGDGNNLLGMIKLKHPDVVLLDINLPGTNGLELLAAIRKSFPEQRVVLFTAHTDLQYIRRGIALKANGYLSKTMTEDELQQAMLSVIQPGAEPVYSSEVAEKIQAAAQEVQASDLTPREYEILIQVAQGRTNRDIANELVLSVKTVDSHVAKLMKKLSMNNRAQLTGYAYEQGLL